MYRVELYYYDHGLFFNRRETAALMERCIYATEFVREHKLWIKLKGDDDIQVMIFDENNEVISTCWAADVKIS